MSLANVMIKDPQGKVRTIKSIPNYSGFGAEAYIRVGLFKREQQFSASEDGAVDNLVNRLMKDGWEVIE